MVIMNDFNFVEIECFNEEKNQKWRMVGGLQEGVDHLVLISVRVKGIDMNTYVVIPKKFVKNIRQLEIK